MSITVVTPASASSAKPSVAPSRTVSRFRITACDFQTRCSHGSSGRSSTSPRNRLSAAWQCVLMSPGITSMPRASISSRAPVPISSAGPTRVIRPSVTATAASRSTAPLARAVTTSALVMIRSAVIVVPARPRHGVAWAIPAVNRRPWRGWIVMPDWLIPGPFPPEFATAERCFMTELMNLDASPEVSLALARVAPGVTTRLHAVAGTIERYVILRGEGIVEIDGRAAPVRPGDVVVIPRGAATHFQCRAHRS